MPLERAGNVRQSPRHEVPAWRTPRQIPTGPIQGTAVQPAAPLHLKPGTIVPFGRSLERGRVGRVGDWSGKSTRYGKGKQPNKRI